MLSCAHQSSQSQSQSMGNSLNSFDILHKNSGNNSKTNKISKKVSDSSGNSKNNFTRHIFSTNNKSSNNDYDEVEIGFDRKGRDKSFSMLHGIGKLLYSRLS